MTPELIAAIKEASRALEGYAKLKHEDERLWEESRALVKEIERLEDRIAIDDDAGAGVVADLRNALKRHRTIASRTWGSDGGTTGRRYNAASAYWDAVRTAQKLFAREFLREDECKALEEAR
jgi:hypothetical protein